jgi:hypothetical protein
MKEMSKKVFVINIRLKQEVFLKVEKLAEIENRTINNMAETLLMRAIADLSTNTLVND